MDMDKKIMFKVSGMHCPSCELIIKDELEGVGAKNVVVSHKNGLGSLMMEETDYSDTKIIEAIKKVGYKAEIIKGNNENAST